MSLASQKQNPRKKQTMESTPCPEHQTYKIDCLGCNERRFIECLDFLQKNLSSHQLIFVHDMNYALRQTYKLRE